MGYCEINDVKEAVSEAKLIQLSNDQTDESLTEVNTDIVNERIEIRTDFINGFIGQHYDLPITNEDALSVLKDICIDLVIYDMYARRGRAELSDNIHRLKNEATSLLKSIQRGDVKLNRTGESSQKQPRHFEYVEKTAKYTDDYLAKMP